RRADQHLCGELAGRRRPGAGEHAAVAGTERGGEGAEQPLLPVGDIDPAGQYHDLGTAAGAAAAPGYDRRRPVRAPDAPTPAAAGGFAAASALERRTRALGAHTGCSRAISASIF